MSITNLSSKDLVARANANPDDAPAVAAEFQRRIANREARRDQARSEGDLKRAESHGKFIDSAMRYLALVNVPKASAKRKKSEQAPVFAAVEGLSASRDLGKLKKADLIALAQALLASLDS
jgi:hypothetical protein